MMRVVGDRRRYRRAAVATALAMAFAGAAAGPARAQFVETTWTVEAFTGEAWYIDPASVIGGTQTFEGGYAEGVFFACDFAGLSMTYTSYAAADFLANQEFALFAPLAEEIGDGVVYVHRISCEGNGDPAARRVLYPFVTTDDHSTAWYEFEGGVFTLGNETAAGK